MPTEFRTISGHRTKLASTSGEEGNDVIEGGDGNDLLAGGDGKDTLRGDAGKDVVFGGLGDDELHGGLGSDVLFGEAGADSFLMPLGKGIGAKAGRSSPVGLHKEQQYIVSKYEYELRGISERKNGEPGP